MRVVCGLSYDGMYDRGVLYTGERCPILSPRREGKTQEQIRPVELAFRPSDVADAKVGCRCSI
jgi:hypothetical protein